MPYKSLAEVGWLHANRPAQAREWDRKYGVPKNLPKKVGKKGGKYRRKASR